MYTVAPMMFKPASAPPPSTYFAEVMADNPLAYWRLAELTGTDAFDLGSTGIDGVYTGTYVLGEPSLCGDAGDFAISIGGTGYVDMGTPAVLKIADTFTYEAIVEPSNPATYRTILAYAAGGCALVLSDSNTLQVLKSNNAIRGFGVSTITARSVVACTVDGAGNLLLYVNGVLDAVGTTAGDYGTPGGFLRIGVDISLANPYSGVVDEVAIYGTALSASRLLAHANAAGL
jgi:hypothetical protein